MAKLSIVMRHDPPENNVVVDGLGRDGVEKAYEALRAALPDFFPGKTFTWQSGATVLVDPSVSIFGWPTISRTITQRFGENPDYYKQFGLDGHEGLDIGIISGTPVRAIGDGVVYSVESQHANRDGHVYGKQIRIDHSDGHKSIYAHLSKVFVKTGEFVRAGQMIANSGNTGNSTGPYLHLTIKLNGKFVDPLPLLG
jgi:murein DD-endopeptidase MepM/ murein hydrolase activator NlpD